MTATRGYVLEQQALHEASRFTFTWWMTLEYASIAAGPGTLLAFVATAFPRALPARWVKGGQLMALGATVFILFTSPLVFSSSLTAFQLVSLLVGGVTLAGVVRSATVQRDRAARLSLAGFALLFFALVKDVLQAQGLAVDGRFYLPLGLVGFVFCQALVVASQNAEARRASDRLNRELLHQVGQRSLGLFQALAKLSAPVAQQASLEPNAVVNGRYRVVRHIASGGMGSVYEVVRLSDGQPFALKLGLGVELTSVARLAREAHFLSTIEHPNVVRVVDVDLASQGFLFFVMELVEGRPLDSLIAEGLSLESARPILQQIAEGLAALHQQGIIHRDLKPSNVLVTDDGTVKLTDFGISLGALATDAAERGVLDETHELSTPAASPSSGDALTRDDKLVGTTAFMAPELLSGRSALTPAIDVFAFGVLAWQVLTTGRPWPTPAIVQRAAGTLEAPRSLRAACPGLPPAAAEVLERCLSEDPVARPSARALAEELRLA